MNVEMEKSKEMGSSKEMNKRKMSPLTNFEKEVLMELVKEYKNIIENKKTDSVSMKQKNETWNEISIKFCSAGNTNKRTGEQLKKMLEQY